jgi:hypothetical protein
LQILEASLDPSAFRYKANLDAHDVAFRVGRSRKLRAAGGIPVYPEVA